jgi:hypothetical protein
MWDLWWTKWSWGRVSPSTSVSFANLHSTNFSKNNLTYHPGLVKYASSGRSTQSPTAQIKKKYYCYILLFVKKKFKPWEILGSHSGDYEESLSSAI